MTTPATSVIGASSAYPRKWSAINWRTIKSHVRRLQMRIAKAIREKRYGKAKALQWLLTHSFYAKLLAVKRTTENRGGKTAGVDGIVWKTSQQKMQASKSLKKRGYHSQPLRRVYIPKKSGKLRPLGIPVMKCRAMQALHLLFLEPVAEMLVDKNAYGFRPRRSTADAIAQCFNTLSRKHSAQWILEGDIRSCFDKISHEWLLSNIPMDKEILSKWLAAGYIDKGVLYRTVEGTPQGGLISPTLMNLTMKGLEQTVSNCVSKTDKVHVVIYADDFIITGKSKELLENKVMPAVMNFLKVRGLELSPEKTRITHIDDGFDFLGFNVRKYNGKLLIKPSKKNVKAFLDNVRDIMKSKRGSKTEVLIHTLNPKIRGWANYFRHGVSKVTFGYVDHCIFQALFRWTKRRHPNKGVRWRRRRYFRRQGARDWIFFTTINNKKRNSRINLDLFNASRVAIKRHIKIKAEATPYDPKYADYLERRKSSKRIVNPYKDQWKKALFNF
jgi:RNA-directed DNA polymerase